MRVALGHRHFWSSFRRLAARAVLIASLSLFSFQTNSQAEDAPEQVTPSTESHVEEDRLSPQLIAGLTRTAPQAWGIELGMALYFQPVRFFPWFIGPKATSLLAWGSRNGEGKTRFDLNTGVDQVLWFTKRFGAGFQAEIVAPSSITGETSRNHLRYGPHIDYAGITFDTLGHLGARLTVPYSSQYKWGLILSAFFTLGAMP